MQKAKAIILFLSLLPLWSAAQCSVCSTVVESSLHNGGNFGKGLNHAILYLLGFPYIIVLGFFTYRYHRLIAFHFRSLIQRWRMS